MSHMGRAVAQEVVSLGNGALVLLSQSLGNGVSKPLSQVTIIPPKVSAEAVLGNKAHTVC